MENIQEVAAALVAAQSELSNPPKTRTAHAGKYSYQYADFADVIDIARPILAKHGLTILHIVQPAQIGASYVMIARILHKSGQYIDSIYPVPDGLSAQELGSWMTYMRRYSTCNMAFMAGETDEDGQKATEGAADIADNKREAAKAALEKMKAEGKLKSAYTGEVIKPDEDVNLSKAETSPATTAEDLSMLNPQLRKAMQRDGISRKKLHAYYVEKGHFPEQVKPEDLDADYIETLLENWKKAVLKMKGK
jgi:hypothetical protein